MSVTGMMKATPFPFRPVVGRTHTTPKWRPDEETLKLEGRKTSRLVISEIRFKKGCTTKCSCPDVSGVGKDLDDAATKTKTLRSRCPDPLGKGIYARISKSAVLCDRSEKSWIYHFPLSCLTHFSRYAVGELKTGDNY